MDVKRADLQQLSPGTNALLWIPVSYAILLLQGACTNCNCNLKIFNLKIIRINNVSNCLLEKYYIICFIGIFIRRF